jgi:hypothetical protein
MVSGPDVCLSLSVRKGIGEGITMNFKKFAGGLALALVVVMFVSALPDIRRYVRISRM